MFVRIIHSVWNIRSVNIRVQHSFWHFWKKIFFCPIFIKITMSHYAEMKVNIYILPTNLPTLYSTKTFLSKKNKTLKLNLNKMFIIEKSTVLISLGMCNWFTLRQETNICLDYFIWNQNHLHLLGRLILANLSLPCCAGLNSLSCGVIDIMIMMIRTVKANSIKPRLHDTTLLYISWKMYHDTSCSPH